ncbi:hypothetical protein QY049_03245 [Bradyrhizobium sp. WYCCWR 13022]|uniref:hypothetical protein n=1 Tax=unclassified Bradyrhizobium TaxID=2631580 RepID=UPI00263B46CD|nr:hypothetical protein [Bradyrhizobium sp. WYCCWR 13022]MDN4982241.1 hypothetical protein [Bradyrhizobium sp. WYCCWR 13022]
MHLEALKQQIDCIRDHALEHYARGEQEELARRLREAARRIESSRTVGFVVSLLPSNPRGAA